MQCKLFSPENLPIAVQASVLSIPSAAMTTATIPLLAGQLFLYRAWARLKNNSPTGENVKSINLLA